MEMNSKLPEFLHWAAKREFCWGKFDCGIWLADWVMLATGKSDPADYLRGRYRSEEMYWKKFGKVPAARVVREAARRAGLKKTKDPLPGDIGVIEINSPKQIVCGAIRGRHGWVALMAGGGLQRIPDDMCRSIMSFRIDEQCLQL